MAELQWHKSAYYWVLSDERHNYIAISDSSFQPYLIFHGTFWQPLQNRFYSSDLETLKNQLYEAFTGSKDA